jgi:hypothetical protein
MTRRPRGAALLLILMAIIVATAAASVVLLRLSVEREGRQDEEQRTQALWLARSAALHGKSGSREIAIGKWKARVATRISSSKVTAEVTGPGGVAKVEATLSAGAPIAWDERYERAQVRSGTTSAP